MIIRGQNIGKTNATISAKTKVFVELLNNIEDSDLMVMDSIDLLTIINQGILPNNDTIKSILITEPCSNERKNALEKIKTDIENGKDIVTCTNSEDEIPVDSEEEGVSNNKGDGIEPEIFGKKEKENWELARLHLIKNLKSIDSNLINAISDKDAINVLMANKLKKMWDGVINGIISINDIVLESEKSGAFYRQIASRFQSEYLSVCDYIPPVGFSANKRGGNGEIKYITPNLMQKLLVHRLKKNRYYGNWSGMGAGKTLSAIISSREIGSHLTVLVVVNSTLNQWKNDVLNAYPEKTGTQVYIVNDGNYDCIDFDMSKYNYVIVPYSRFSQHNEEQKLKNIADKKVDLIVIDEVHKAKRRDEKEESKRRERLMKFIGWSKETNPDMYELVMSGTPIINELSEAKSLLTLLTGKTFDDIKTNRTLSNALKLHQMLLIYGIRFVPKYDQVLNILTSENTSSLKIAGDKYLQALKLTSSLNAEKMFVDDKLESIKQYLSKGVIIYTHYTTGFISKIRSFVENLGFSTALYSDNREIRDLELDKFRNGEVDILVASDPINTGVDRLQEVCSTMIIITLPWTNADFEQLKARIYRQGMSRESEITIVIPQVVVKDVNGDEWSWDKQRYNLIKSKKTLADCVIDGVIPSTNFPTRETLYKKSVECLKIWQDRVNNGGLFAGEDSGVDIDLTVNIEEEQNKRIQSIISNFNHRGRVTNSKRFHAEIIQNKEEWFNYHNARHENMKTWDEIPYEYIARKIKNKNRVVADFGCGENMMKTFIPNNKVYSFDHVAIDDSVIACDMAHTPLDDESIDIAVFSLSLWGSNYEDYFKEAYRLLTYNGLMYIAEPTKAYDETQRENLVGKLQNNKFELIGNIEIRGKFFYIKVIKK